MLAEESLRDGNLDKALAELQDAVRSDSSSSRNRVFLFQLLCVRGEWERAATQIKVLGEMDSATLAMVQMYGAALSCEGMRKDVFAGKRSPLIFDEPAEWIALMLESLKAAAEERHEQANELRQKALDEAPGTAGQLTNKAGETIDFNWLMDGDARLGPLLEAVIQAKYFWIPFDRIKSIELDEPADLRDLVWAPAQFTWANGGQEVGLIPTRYPGSDEHEDPLIKLSRKTDWTNHGEGVDFGLGQRMLATDADDYSLLELRSIVFDQPMPSLGPAGDEAAGDQTAGEESSDAEN
jgi:type VI secretion system protein ImpE